MTSFRQMMECETHDHSPTTGECLVSEWVGANVPRYTPEMVEESMKLQKRVEANHAKWLIGEHKRMEKENTSPF